MSRVNEPLKPNGFSLGYLTDVKMSVDGATVKLPFIVSTTKSGITYICDQTRGAFLEMDCEPDKKFAEKLCEIMNQHGNELARAYLDDVIESMKKEGGEE